MNASNLAVNCAMRFRRSSNPKLIFGRESAIDGACADDSGGRMPLVESDGSNEAIVVYCVGLGVSSVMFVGLKRRVIDTDD